MKIFSPKAIHDIFRYTIEHDDVTMDQLVDRAGEGVAKEIDTLYGKDYRMVVFAGWGTKGAYALAACHHLLQMGYNPEIYLFNIGGNRLTTECFNARKTLKRDFPNCNLYEIEQNFDNPEIDSTCLVIDGLFGIDLDKPLPKSFGMVIRSLNESEADIVSIGIPSGLFAEWNTNNSISRDIIHATVTLAIEFPCLSFFMHENIKLIGDWKILNIGLSKEAIRITPYDYYLVTQGDVHRTLLQRRPDTSKADYGSALICAGSYGMMGAAVLAASGCLRAGAGKVTLYSPRCGYTVAQTAVPCAMFKADTREDEISRIVPDTNYNAIAVGPGIGTSDTTITAVENFLKMCFAKRQPLVIDADALNCIAHRPMMLNYIPQFSVMTPHAGEFDRIFGAQPSAEARLRKAFEVSAYHNIIIILKGRYSMVVRPDGKAYINSSGTPALATPGSGDVLTGVITALMAQGYTPETSSIIATFVHGFAGEICERTHGSYGVIASDVASNIGIAINTIMQNVK